MTRAEKTEGAAATAPSTDSLLAESTRKRSTRYRNSHRHGAATRAAALAALAEPTTPLVGLTATEGGVGAGAAGLLLSRALTPREAWIEWLSPRFSGNASAYLTGTYREDYGLAHGLMLQRNVHKDFRRYLESFAFQGDYIVAVERHAYRDILHLHAILAGPYNDEQLKWLKGQWSVDRGHARVLPVLDGCASYVTKYALKNDTDAFEWRLS